MQSKSATWCMTCSSSFSCEAVNMAFLGARRALTRELSVLSLRNLGSGEGIDWSLCCASWRPVASVKRSRFCLVRDLLSLASNKHVNRHPGCLYVPFTFDMAKCVSPTSISRRRQPSYSRLRLSTSTINHRLEVLLTLVKIS